MNSQCYHFEKLEFENYYYKNIDATYIITMTNSKRVNNARETIKKYRLSPITYIVHNDGFKKCNKILYKKTTMYDIIDAYGHIFKDAYLKKYNNIVILEDDYIFHPDIIKNNVIDDINNFLVDHKNESYIYLLGTLPLLRVPNFSDNSHYRILFFLTVHASIYSKKLIEEMVQRYNKINKHIDVYFSISFKKYCYKYPLAFQQLSETENQSQWIKTKMFNDILVSMVKGLNLDKDPEDGFRYSYHLSVLIFYLIIFYILLFFLTLFFLSKNV